MATLLNRELNVLVLHIPRTAGTSREFVLQHHGFEPVTWGAGNIRLCDLPSLLGDSINDETNIVAVLRHPAKRELSHWQFCHDHPEHAEYNNQFYWPLQHASVNTMVADWRCQPIHYYERLWHKKEYGHVHDGELSDISMVDAYRYWLIDHTRRIPMNVDVVLLEDQDRYFSKLLGETIRFPRKNKSQHPAWQDAFNKDGLLVISRLYWWTVSNYYPEDFNVA